MKALYLVVLFIICVPFFFWIIAFGIHLVGCIPYRDVISTDTGDAFMIMAALTGAICVTVYEGERIME